MRYFLSLSYNGAPFHGWQSQPNASSVQQTIEEALATMFRRQVPIVGAGRTDTGVNARTMIAHLDLDEPLTDDRKFLTSINRLCGRDIAIHSIRPVKNDAHARFDAVSRTYKYFVTFSKNPFLYPLSWYSSSPLDIDAMNQAAALLIHTSDFTSFAKLHSDTKTNICNVTQAHWSALNSSTDDSSSLFSNSSIVFTITADRFLRNMVRAVVGTLVDVGRRKLSFSDFADIIALRNRCAAGNSMPPQALFLWDIDYPVSLFI